MKQSLVLGCSFAASVVVLAEERVDLHTVHRIRTEAFERSRVMENVFYLTDVHGPRLTNSPEFRAAGEWTVKRLKDFGLENAKLEKWGPFGRGWTYSKYQAHIVAPVYQPLIGFPMAWSPGTEGILKGEPILAPMRADEDFKRWEGKLKGKIVLVDTPRETPIQTRAQGRRLSEMDLNERFFAIIPGGRSESSGETPRLQTGPAGPPRRIGPRDPDQEGASESNSERNRRMQGRRNEFLKKEGAIAIISTGYRGDGGTVFASAAGSYNSRYPDPPPAIAVTPEHYNRIVRLLEKSLSVQIEMEVKARFFTEDPDSFNIVGEIPGSRKKDEVVMVGAHFDSWHGGTGATDNAAGSSVMMEALRILKSLDLKMDRTVRIALWSGEEQGLLGSKAYVKEHFGDPETMKITGQHAKLAAYFNYDNGTGKIRGVHLQGNDMVRPIFESWIEPFKDLGANTLTIRTTGGTDHLSFDAVGLPGFQFIQDPVEYETRTHHSNMDVYDHIVETDLKQASAIVASFAYHAATRPEMLPRKPLPKPRPRRDGKANEGRRIVHGILVPSYHPRVDTAAPG